MRYGKTTIVADSEAQDCYAEEVRKIEQLLETALPADYRKFLLHTGGHARPEPDLTKVTFKKSQPWGKHYNPSSVGWFNDVQSILEQLRSAAKKGTPSLQVVIADDKGSGSYVMSIAPKEKGRIYLQPNIGDIDELMLLQEEEGKTDEEVNRLARGVVARSFTEFVKNLFPVSR